MAAEATSQRKSEKVKLRYCQLCQWLYAKAEKFKDKITNCKFMSKCPILVQKCFCI